MSPSTALQTRLDELAEAWNEADAREKWRLLQRHHISEVMAIEERELTCVDFAPERKALVAALGELHWRHCGLLAVQRFLLATPLADALAQVNWADLAAAANPVVSFRLSGDLELVCQRPDVILAVAHAAPNGEPGSGLTCLT